MADLSYGTNLFTDGFDTNTSVAMVDSSGYALLCKCTGVPQTTTGLYQVGCHMIRTDGSSGTTDYFNTGTLASPSWSSLSSVVSGLPASLTDSTSAVGATSLAITESTITTGKAVSVTDAGLTTGIIYNAVATAATLTTGFYYAANDGALNVFTVGANGHITSKQTTAPTIAIVASAGITAAAITTGGTDTCGQITTTGTNSGAADTTMTVTFNKTYTNAPKAVLLQPLNAGGAASFPFVTSIGATSFTIDIPKSASSATPSFAYLVIA